MKKAGIRNVAVNVHHLGEMIRAHVRSRTPRGLSIRFSEEARLLGTGGGAQQAARLMKPAPLLIMAGDIVIDLDPAELLDAHLSSKAAATIVLTVRGDVHRYGGVLTNDENSITDIAGILGRRGGDLYVNASVYVVDKELHDRLPGPGRCLVRDFFIPLLREGFPLNAFVHEGFWAEGGTPERLLDLNTALLDLESLPGTRHNISARTAGPASVGRITVGRDVLIGPHSVISDGCRLGDGCRIDRSILLPGAAVHPGERLEETIRSLCHEWTVKRREAPS